MMARLRFRGGSLALVAATALAASPACAGTKDWDNASTAVLAALVAASVGVPALHEDWNGAAQAGGSAALAGAATFGLKDAFPETRPDLSDRKSFPSGHTSVAFAAAASLENRNGWQVGLPAHVAALFVGVARVEARKHHWYDVAVGAGIGEATGLLLTHRRDSAVQVFPWAESKAAGVDMAMRF